MELYGSKPRHKTIVSREIRSIQTKIERSYEIIFKLRWERSIFLDAKALDGGSLDWSKQQADRLDLSIKGRFNHIRRWRKQLADLYAEFKEATS